MRRESDVDLTIERSALSLDAPLGDDRISGWRW
jgi:hypothetical protein